ncbi:MAG TPA: helix-turn-helix domain-containing protein [Anaerolineaceae bacterium]|nr:helix-turn-helix domain-containing protein [Anaerolineaceae bacterium]
MDPSETSEYLKIAEAAQFLGVSRRTIYRWVWSGDLPANRVGGLYLIRRADLQAMLTRKQPAAVPEQSAEPALLKCGVCYRLIQTDQQVGEACAAEGCYELICARCYAEGHRHCVRHSPTREQRLAEAREQKQRGELSVMVEANNARLREINYLTRIQIRLTRFASLLHPLSSETLNIPDWDGILESGDERAEVMRLLGRVVMDAEQLMRYPVNPWLHYSLPLPRQAKGGPVSIKVHLLSHLAPMVREGFDTVPFRAEDLSTWVMQLSNRNAADGFELLLLGASTGWDNSARRILLGDNQEKGSSPLVHRYGLLYLFDMEKGELIFSPVDERARRYAELFRPMLFSEEVEEANRLIQSEMITFSSLTLREAAQMMSYPEPVIRQAFESLASTGRYSLIESPEFGLALVKN